MTYLPKNDYPFTAENVPLTRKVFRGEIQQVPLASPREGFEDVPVTVAEDVALSWAEREAIAAAWNADCEARQGEV